MSFALTSIFVACSNTPTLLSESKSLGVTDVTMAEVQQELSSGYVLWQQEKYPEAYESLQHLNQITMKEVWPVLREADPESALQLEVQYGRVLWALEHKRTYEGTDVARSMQRLLLREMSDVKIIVPDEVESVDPATGATPAN